MLPPPYYVLLSHSSLSTSGSTSVNPPHTLVHPIIQYQYRDDPPLPSTSAQHVIIMDYNPTAPDDVHVQSLSPQIAVTSIKVADAPGTAPAGADEEQKNTKMYVLETVAHHLPDRSAEKLANVEDIPSVGSVTSFRQRNALLRKALEYPLPSASLALPTDMANAPTASPRPSPYRTSVPLPSVSPTA